MTTESVIGFLVSRGLLVSILGLLVSIGFLVSILGLPVSLGWLVIACGDTVSCASDVCRLGTDLDSLCCRSSNLYISKLSLERLGSSLCNRVVLLGCIRRPNDKSIGIGLSGLPLVSWMIGDSVVSVDVLIDISCRFRLSIKLRVDVLTGSSVVSVSTVVGSCCVLDVDETVASFGVMLLVDNLRRGSDVTILVEVTFLVTMFSSRMFLNGVW